MALASKGNAKNFREKDKRLRMKFTELRDGREETCRSHNILFEVGNETILLTRKVEEMKGPFHGAST